MPFLGPNGVSAPGAVVLPAGQKIVLSSFGPGTAKVSQYNPQLNPDNIMPGLAFLASFSGGSLTLGPYGSNVNLYIEAGACVLEYVTGAAPVLTIPPAYVIAITDTSGTPGNATINTQSGRAAIAAAGTTVTITSSLCTAASKVELQLETVDATCKSLVVVPGAGSFVVTANAATTGICKFSFIINN